MSRVCCLIVPWLIYKHVPGLPQLTNTLPLFILCGFLWVWIGRYYERTYGKVEPIADRTRKRMAEIGLVGGLIGVIVLENVLFYGGTYLPVNLTGLAIAVIFLLTGVKTHRWYYTFSGLVMLVVSCLPLIFGTGAGDPLVGTGGLLFEILFGLVILMVGILDHLRLVRAFHPTQEAGHARNS